MGEDGRGWERMGYLEYLENLEDLENLENLEYLAHPLSLAFLAFHLLVFFKEHLAEGVGVVFDFSVEDGILDVGFEDAHLLALGEAKHLHDLMAVDARLEQTLVVLLLECLYLLPDDAEIVEEALLSRHVLAGDVRLAKKHQLVDIVLSVIE